MGRVFHLLLILSVMWCGSHIGEPAEPPLPPAQLAYALDAHLLPSEADRSDDASGHADGSDHHHCPVAPGMPAPPACSETQRMDALLFAQREPAMASLSRAPPVQPPSA